MRVADPRIWKYLIIRILWLTGLGRELNEDKKRPMGSGGNGKCAETHGPQAFSAFLLLISLAAFFPFCRRYSFVPFSLAFQHKAATRRLQGLISWWPGDGNANDLTNTNNGVLKGGATATAAGLVSQAFQFRRHQRLCSRSPMRRPRSTPRISPSKPGCSFSSLNSTASGGSPAGDQYIVFKQNANTYNFEGIDLSKTRHTPAATSSSLLVTSASGRSVQVNSATTIGTNVWYHVAAVRGSNFTQLYVNGQLQSQTNVTFAQSYGTLPLYFGTSGQSYWDHKLAGNLDEVTLYNRPLASNEIAAIYAAGSAGKCKSVSGLTIATQPQSQAVAVGAATCIIHRRGIGNGATELPVDVQRRGYHGCHQTRHSASRTSRRRRRATMP